MPGTSIFFFFFPIVSPSSYYLRPLIVSETAGRAVYISPIDRLWRTANVPAYRPLTRRPRFATVQTKQLTVITSRLLIVQVPYYFQRIDPSAFSSPCGTSRKHPIKLI